MRLEVTVRGDRGVVPPGDRAETWSVPARFPFGFGTWLTFAYLGVRARRRDWLYASAGYFSAIVAGSVIASAGGPSITRAAIGVGIWTATWLGGLVHVRRVRPEVRALLGFAGDVERARDEIARRRHAIDLARREPETARELGIGSAADPHGYGLLDVNAATADELTALPGVDRDTARRIVAARERDGGFTSVAELGHDADLPPSTVDALQDRVVFLPRRG